MITAVWKMPDFLCYIIAFTGILCTLYSGIHKNKYKTSGKLLTYCACLFDVATGIVSIMTKSFNAQIILGIIEFGLLIIALIIEIRSAKWQGLLFVLGRFIAGCVMGCVIVYLFTVINIVLGVLATAAVFFFFSFFDDGSTYYDPNNELDFSSALVDNEYCKVDYAYKDYSGRNIIRLRNENGSDYLEQDYEGSYTYHCRTDNSEYIRSGNSFIKK